MNKPGLMQKFTMPHSSVSFSINSKERLREIKDTYLNYLNSSKQPYISSYPIKVLKIRSQVVNWLIIICKQFSFTVETLFYTVCIFDRYISASASIKTEYSLYEMNLIAIACLSLATKQEEINCNFIQFFTDNILNTSMNKIYKTKDVAVKELDILKTLQFKTLYSNAYDYDLLFMQMLQADKNIMLYAKDINDEIIIAYLAAEWFINHSQQSIALFAFKETILQLSVYNLYSGNDELNALFQQIVTLNQIASDTIISKMKDKQVKENDDSALESSSTSTSTSRDTSIACNYINSN